MRGFAASEREITARESQKEKYNVVKPGRWQNLRVPF
jgi:hypothetical protein